MLALREGWSLEMRILSRIKTSSSEAPEDNNHHRSLFINTPIHEIIINIIHDQLFFSVQLFHGFSREQFKDFLNLGVKNCLFVFSGKFYDQIEGVAMGSPLGPHFYNIFLSFHEQRRFDNCPAKFKPAYYRHFTDDALILFRSKDHIIPFLESLNSPT